MDIMEAVTYPTKDENYIVKLLFSFLTLVPLVGGLVVTGYQLQTIRHCAGRERVDNLPEWDNWMQFLTDGFMFAVITFVYVFIPSILILIATVFSAVLPDDLRGVIVLGAAIVALILVVIAVFAVPMAMVVYAMTGNLMACLNIFAMINLAGANSGKYVRAILIPFGMGLVLSFVLGAFTIIPILGQVIAIAFIPGGFYIGLVGSRLLADVASSCELTPGGY